MLTYRCPLRNQRPNPRRNTLEQSSLSSRTNRKRRSILLPRPISTIAREFTRFTANPYCSLLNLACMLSSTVQLWMFWDDGYGSPERAIRHCRSRRNASRRGALELESSFGQDRLVPIHTLYLYRGWDLSDAKALGQAPRCLVPLRGEGLDCQPADVRLRHSDVTAPIDPPLSLRGMPGWASKSPFSAPARFIAKHAPGKLPAHSARRSPAVSKDVRSNSR
jgi:hypothetical protein